MLLICDQPEYDFYYIFTKIQFTLGFKCFFGKNRTFPSAGLEMQSDNDSPEIFTHHSLPDIYFGSQGVLYALWHFTLSKVMPEDFLTSNTLSAL